MEGLQGEFRAALVAGSCGEDAAVREGREAELAAHFHFLFRVSIEVMLAGELDAGAVRGESLDDDFAFKLAASGTPGDLGDELEGALARAEIRDVQAEIRIQNPDQGDVGEMQSFGDHLRADKDVDFLGFEFPEYVFERVFTAHRIGIDAGEAGFRQDFL